MDLLCFKVTEERGEGNPSFLTPHSGAPSHSSLASFTVSPKYQHLHLLSLFLYFGPSVIQKHFSLSVKPQGEIELLMFQVL